MTVRVLSAVAGMLIPLAGLSAAYAAETPAATVRADERGFSIESADGANRFRLRGLVHFDGRRYFNDDASPTADTWTVSRVRPYFDGTIGIYDFRIMPEFGSGKSDLLDAYVRARLNPALNVTVGKFKSPFGLERLRSVSDTSFHELALPSNLVPNRDIGIKIGGDLAGGALSYEVAHLNGTSDGGSTESNPTPDADNDEEKDFVVRLWSEPFKSNKDSALAGLGFGIAATYVDSTGTATSTLLPRYRSAGRTTFFNYRTGATPTIADGERVRWSPQFYYGLGSVGVLGEYVRVSQDVGRTTGTGTRTATLDHDAWQLAVSWFLTGEKAGYRASAPKQSFDPVAGGGRGAIELKARYGVLDIDDAALAGGADSFADPLSSASKATAWAVGVNWHLTRNVKALLDYEQTSFDGGTATGDRPDEEVLLGRIQLSF